MKLLFVLCIVAPSCLGFLAHIQKIRDHVSAKLKKPECHVEWEDVTTPHCETHQEQVCVEEYKNQCTTEFSTSCQTEYNTKCETKYEELCETTDHQKCHTEHDQQCHDEFSEECKTEYSEECWDQPREACHTESSQECSTEYSEVCGTEYEQACHTEYTEECWDEPECWLEEREECHDVQVKVKHHDHQPKQKWKRSVDGEASEAEDTGLEDEGEGNNDEKVEAAKLTGAVVGGHFGKKLGLGAGLAIGLGAKKHASKDEDHPVHLKKAHAAPIV